LPGVFATGTDMEDLRRALTEAISMYLSEPGEEKHVELEDEPGSVTEHRMLARTA
jgi:predicted RNase H-like HicB family nuclease